jgi:hypothetical protein
VASEEELDSVMISPRHIVVDGMYHASRQLLEHLVYPAFDSVRIRSAKAMVQPKKPLIMLAHDVHLRQVLRESDIRQYQIAILEGSAHTDVSSAVLAEPAAHRREYLFIDGDLAAQVLLELVVIFELKLRQEVHLEGISVRFL